MNKRKLKTPWDFVEQYYPNYTNSDEIALSDDLQKIADNEEEIDSNAYTLLMITYNGSRRKAIRDLIIVNHSIYEKAIEGYIK